MIPKYHRDEDFFEEMTELCSETDPSETPNLVLLTKADCYMLHRYISMEFDCICEDLTWNNDLVFNTETFTHKDMYENLFKLKFKGVQLGQL